MAKVIIVPDMFELGVDVIAAWGVSDNLVQDVARYVEDAVRTLVIEQAKTELLSTIDAQVAAVVNERVTVLRPLGG